mgnify:CR=1 FL=1
MISHVCRMPKKVLFRSVPRTYQALPNHFCGILENPLDSRRGLPPKVKVAGNMAFIILSEQTAWAAELRHHPKQGWTYSTQAIITGWWYTYLPLVKIWVSWDLGWHSQYFFNKPSTIFRTSSGCMKHGMCRQDPSKPQLYASKPSESTNQSRSYQIGRASCRERV